MDFVQLMLKRVRTAAQMEDITPQGFSAIERLREMLPHECAMFTTLEKLLNHHAQFLDSSVKTGSKVLEKLRGGVSSRANAGTSINGQRGSRLSFYFGSDPPGPPPVEIIPRARLDHFIDTAFAGHISLLEVHSKFKSRLETRLRDFAASRGDLSGSWVANEFLIHSKELMDLYRDHGERILEAPRLIFNEGETNPAFRDFLSVSLVHGSISFIKLLNHSSHLIHYRAPAHLTMGLHFVKFCQSITTVLFSILSSTPPTYLSVFPTSQRTRIGIARD